MRLIEGGWRFLKSNPLLNSVLIILIVVGIILISMLHFVGFSKSSGTETIEGNALGYGYGHEIDKGDIIEVEYEIYGEDVEVYLIKGYMLPFDKDDEDILVDEGNLSSGTIIYEAKEDGMHMVYFKGHDFSVSYTYNVIKPWFSVFIIIIGLILIGLGMAGMWYINHIPNPKYLGNSMRNTSVILGLLGIVFLGMIFIFPIDDVISYVFPFYMIIFSVQYHYLGKLYNKQYNIRCRERSTPCAKKIKVILDGKGIKYKERKFVKEYLIKWDTIFDLEGSDAKIRLRNIRFQNDKSMVFVGKQSAVNKVMLIQLANDIARELECRNYTPVSL